MSAVVSVASHHLTIINTVDDGKIRLLLGGEESIVVMTPDEARDLAAALASAAESQRSPDDRKQVL